MSNPHGPDFPVYIVSKGRWKTRFTVKTLEKIGVPYRVVVEQGELDSYATVIPRERLLILDPAYQERYDTFDDLGVAHGRGSGPARNFVWDHAVAEGHAWHWIMDDNIRYFYRLNENQYGEVTDGTVFRCMEDFVLRYENVAMAGPNYFMFAPRKQAMPPYRLNTRIYSCILIRNDAPYRWRGRYNEDTDLSLRVLKDGWCTVLFSAFLQHKEVTMRVAGGNTDTIYRVGTMPKSKMLKAMHPDVAEVVKRWDRPHHFVDYRSYEKNVLIRKPGVNVPLEANNYGMAFEDAERRNKSVPYSQKAIKDAAPGGPERRKNTRKSARATR